LYWVLAFVACVILITRFYLDGPNLRRFDSPAGRRFDSGKGLTEEHQAVIASLSLGAGPIRSAPRNQRLQVMRDYMDGMSDGLNLPASFSTADADGVAAEWVIAPGADPARRLLYIHGGAFMVGSPKSHRNITNRFSEIARAAVLAIDYRLMPEHPRMAGIQDCRTAYRWILDNGPTGRAPAERLYVSGDSAGGNLSLSLSAWIRDAGLRQPDAVVGLCPLTDSTVSSPSMKQNLETDAMLGPSFKYLARVPRALLLWFLWLQNRIRPSSPLVSPLLGDLSGLPPTLIQASEHEMLYSDGLRYANRAAAAGSPVKLQSWPHVVHVWHLFYPQLTEAREAWDEIETFIRDIG